MGEGQTHMILFRNYEGEIADLAEIQQYNEEISAAVFWSSSESTYQDWCGNWREIGDTEPTVFFPAPEIIEGEIIEGENE